MSSLLPAQIWMEWSNRTVGNLVGTLRSGLVVLPPILHRPVGRLSLAVPVDDIGVQVGPAEEVNVAAEQEGSEFMT